MSGSGSIACYKSSAVVHALVLHTALHVLSTPRYDTERNVWSEDIMRFDTKVC